MRQTIRENVRIASLNPKFMVLIKRVYLEGFWFHNACSHNFVKRISTRSKSFEGMRLITELAALNCFYYSITLVEEFQAPQTILQVSCLMTMAQCVSEYSACPPA